MKLMRECRTSGTNEMRYSSMAVIPLLPPLLDLEYSPAPAGLITTAMDEMVSNGVVK